MPSSKVGIVSFWVVRGLKDDIYADGQMNQFMKEVR